MVYGKVELNKEKLNAYSKVLGSDFAHAYAHMRLKTTGQTVEAELKQLAENKDKPEVVLQYSSLLLGQIGQMMIPVAQGEKRPELVKHASALTKGVYSLLEGVGKKVGKNEKEAYAQMSKLYQGLSEAYASNNTEKVKTASLQLIKILEESAKQQEVQAGKGKGTKTKEQAEATD